MLDEILVSGEKKFLQEYYELLVSRVAHSTMSLEKDLGNVDDSSNAIRLLDNMKAFKKLLEVLSFHGELSLELITMIADMINESSMFISRGYRKIGKFLADTDIPISDSSHILEEMENLLEKYQTEWTDMDVFEREAYFHIMFIRIHPYEDGNGRCARLLLNFNLLKQGYAPVIITDDLREFYESYIREFDVSKMARLFQIQSKREHEVIQTLYQEYEQENIKKL